MAYRDIMVYLDPAPDAMDRLQFAIAWPRSTWRG